MIQLAGEFEPYDGKVVVRVGRGIHFIELGKISYIEACNYYALIHTDRKTFVVRQTLYDFEKKLNNYDFMRIHRSIIINLNIFTSIEKENKRLIVRTSIGKEFRISRYRQKEIRTRILMSNAA